MSKATRDPRGWADALGTLDPSAGRLLEGCNPFDDQSVFVLPADIPGAALEIESGHAAAFFDRLSALDPEPSDTGSRLRFLARLDRGEATFSEALLQMIHAIDRSLTRYLRHTPRSNFSAVVDDPERETGVLLAWSSSNARLARLAAGLGHAGVLELLAGAEGEAEALDWALDRVRGRLKKRRRTEGAALAAAAAIRADLPHELLGMSYIRLGDGAHQQTISTSAITSGLTGSEPGERVEQAGRLLHTMCGHPPPARIPAVVVAGDRQASVVAAEIERLLRAAGHSVGLSSAGHVTIGGKPVETVELSRNEVLRFLRRDPRVEVLVHTAPPGRVRRHGLRLSRCRVVVVLAPTKGRDAAIYRQGVEVAVRAATGPVLLDLRHPLTAELLSGLDPERVILTGGRRGRRDIELHAGRGGVGVLPAADKLPALEILAGGESVRTLELPPAATEDRVRRNALVKAVGVALGLGLSREDIASAMPRFSCLRD
ncbi:hypothetical protein ABI59_21990 [Acidobacteria bacterium Mor1]|nr:hypothetical protein ABI59_21990 [Acidobacteria bacterium Mor1]